MPTPTNERPTVTLTLTGDSLIAEWGPTSTPWGPDHKIVPIKYWWLFVGTKVRTKKLSEDEEKAKKVNTVKLWDPEEDGGFQWEIFNGIVGAETERMIPKYFLPKKRQVFAQVIGFFDSKSDDGKTAIDEGIYSAVTHVMVP